MPAPAARAQSHASVFVSRASVSTQTSVVASRPERPRRPCSRSTSEHRTYPPSRQIPASTEPSSSSTSPTALTTAIAAMTPPSPSSRLAMPRPPFVHPSRRSFPTVQPVPAPTLPRSGDAVAASHAAYPASAVGHADALPRRGHRRRRPRRSARARPASDTRGPAPRASGRRRRPRPARTRYRP